MRTLTVGGDGTVVGSGKNAAVPGEGERRKLHGSRWRDVAIFAGLAAAAPAVGILAADAIFGSAARVDDTAHVACELAGSCIALGVAVLLTMRARMDASASHLAWVAASLVAMGMTDLVHGLAPVGIAWSWLRHVATLEGGVLLALVWLPPSRASPDASASSRPLLRVRANPAALTQVFSNLLGNAVKFVAAGKQPRVVVWAEARADATGRWVRFWVEDNGIGMTAEDTSRIFGMFQRLRSADAYAGTGMGLAIARKAIDRMGGRLGVESELGSGSRFWFELPEAP